MLIQKTTLTGLWLLLNFLIAVAQESAFQKIDTEEMRKNLTYLASDELQGRRLGTTVDGLNMAADFILTNVQEIGLKPGIPGYFQPVPLVAVHPDAGNALVLKNFKDKTGYHSNDLVLFHGNDEDWSIRGAEAVLVGFGTADSQVDLAGKIVIVAQGDKDSFTQTGSFAWKSREEMRKARILEEKHPAAVLFITNPTDRFNRTFNEMKLHYDRESYQTVEAGNSGNTPWIVALPEFADKLLGGKGKYKNYLEGIVKGKSETAMPIDKWKIDLTWKTIRKQITAKNIVAVVEGSDPVLKNECVVFMAHYDHIGVDSNGDVFNGADDNGSGTVTIMEVAKAFASLDPKPKRSIVFLWVTCEELGMFGSSYYTEHPVFPLQKTVACINLDMVGRVYEPADSIWNKSPKKVKDFDGLFTLSNEVWPGLAAINSEKCKKLGIVPDTSLPPYFMRASDHYQFHKNGVPILNYATGYHADYHQLGDEVDKINFQKMKRVAELCFLVGLEVANLDSIERKTGKE